ncbi:MAG TPA: leucyl aminopeptidase [Steroidobacteraceae bacterium]|nr:leucyl aminopeptidase [Steroidobacteraceae bacterium]
MIRFDTPTGRLASQPADCLAVGLFDEDALPDTVRTLDSATGGRLRALRASGDLPVKLGDTQLLLQLPGVRARRVLVVGLGKRADFNRRAWRKAIAAALAACIKGRSTHLALALERPDSAALNDYYFGRAIADLTTSALYRINDQKSGRRPQPPALRRVSVAGVDATARAAVVRGLTHGAAIGGGQSLLRDLGNLPANICTPRYLADQARAIARAHRSVRVRIFDEAQIRRLKMGCLLAVSRGSAEPPRFIVLEYKGGRRNAPPVVLVGKGVTFDTGGISLKDPAAMDEMKFDMCGAGSVLGALQVAAELKLPLNVVGLIAAVENMPGSRATKPGDIATSAAGKTVEILNTDAEGRLILCDALHYARRYEPAAVVDIATLTGACVIALGHHFTGVMANDDALAAELVRAGADADDRAWQLPLTEDYAEQLRSNFADLANVAGRDGGAITAGAFLGRFTQGMRWAHLDIAGTAWLSGAQKGGTGRPVGLLAEFLLRRAGRA